LRGLKEKIQPTALLKKNALKDSHQCRLVAKKSGFEQNAKPCTVYRVVFCKMACAVMDMCNSNSFMKHDVSVSATVFTLVSLSLFSANLHRYEDHK
jgi:hypothetical protein